MYKRYNPNPEGLLVGDCVVRAICAIENRLWYDVYSDLALKGLDMSDMPTSNRVWGQYLREKGYKCHKITSKCPLCYTAYDFCIDHPHGSYLLATGTHVIAVKNGNYYDAWDSGHVVPTSYWSK